MGGVNTGKVVGWGQQYSQLAHIIRVALFRMVCTNFSGLVMQHNVVHPRNHLVIPASSNEWNARTYVYMHESKNNI